MKLKFYGASDDLMEVEGGIREEWGCFGRPCILRVYSPKSDEGLLVIGEYGRTGVWATWMLGAAQLDEGVEIPDWDIRVCNSHAYSCCLEIECPDDCVITELC